MKTQLWIDQSYFFLILILKIDRSKMVISERELFIRIRPWKKGKNRGPA